MSRSRRWAAVLVFAVAIAARVPFLVALRGEITGDIGQIFALGDATAHGEDPYESKRYNYPPAVLFFSALLEQIALRTGVTFDVLLKLPAILADGAISVVLLLSVSRRLNRLAPALAASLGYALNPVAVIITAIHGQLDAVPLACSLAAILLVESSDPWESTLSALLLGSGIALKAWPALFLPIAIRYVPGGLRRRTWFFLAACLPTLVTLLPFFLYEPHIVLRSVFGYSGVTDQGWVAAMRCFWLLKSGNEWLPGPMGQNLCSYSKFIFLAVYAVLVWRKQVRPARHCLIVLLAFYVIYGGLSSQYLLWVLPFGLIEVQPFIVPYSLLGAAAAIFCYLLWMPDITRSVLPVVPRRTAAFGHGITTTLWWLVCVAWLARLLIRNEKQPRRDDRAELR